MIKILVVNLRGGRDQFQSIKVDWTPDMTAFRALELGLGSDFAHSVAHDLSANNPDILVAWNSASIHDHSEVGGVGDLDWYIPDQSILTISYQDDETSEAAIDRSSEWMLAQLETNVPT